MVKDSKMHALWCVFNFYPPEVIYSFADFIYSFYDFKEYMLMIFSFKNIHQIFLNGIYFKGLRIYQIFLRYLMSFSIFRKII
jgi:hypothetical protein